MYRLGHSLNQTDSHTAIDINHMFCLIFQQAFTAFGPSIIQPTWFCERAVFDRAGPFSVAGKVSINNLLSELGLLLLKVTT